MVKHKSGLEILAGSDQFDRPGAADGGGIEELLRLLARQYEYIVVDAGSQINSCTVAALYAADTMYLVANPDVPSIRNAQRLLDRVRQLGACGERVRVLLNRAAEPYPIPPKQIEGALGHPIHHTFPSDYKTVSTALELRHAAGADRQLGHRHAVRSLHASDSRSRRPRPSPHRRPSATCSASRSSRPSGNPMMTTLAQSGPLAPSSSALGGPGRPLPTQAPRAQYVELKANVHRKMLNRLNLEALSQSDRSRAESEIRTLVAELLSEEGTPISLGERETLLGELLDEVFGLGPLEPLLRDPSISDILVNTYKNVFVERGGHARAGWRPRFRTTVT